MEHFQYPVNRREMQDADRLGSASMNGRPPFVTIFLKLDGCCVCECSFKADGCGATIAACSAMIEMIEGKSMDECLSLSDVDLIDALNGIPPDKRHCVAIALQALRDCFATADKPEDKE